MASPWVDQNPVTIVPMSIGKTHDGPVPVYKYSVMCQTNSPLHTPRWDDSKLSHNLVINPLTKSPTFWQTTFWNAFSWLKMIEFRFKFHWNLFPGVQLTVRQHGFRQWLGAWTNDEWIHWRIYAALGGGELTIMDLMIGKTPVRIILWCSTTKMVIKACFLIQPLEQEGCCQKCCISFCSKVFINHFYQMKASPECLFILIYWSKCWVDRLRKALKFPREYFINRYIEFATIFTSSCPHRQQPS